eukprot:CAMPEP_0113729642 /NCGR_PEP_ID=MMETSP0038_2-20120614/42678_1 /TAXON_ID=2898 /ORGANISM="Cryptomonas paramecium" /LENGTH=40 /DNA_ID=CAMNT_0000661537 /DNA_START=123 /DNA_END=245 /DNA_ORIENTATION=+ /assembly_acc=CAM_ASM_000170
MASAALLVLTHTILAKAIAICRLSEEAVADGTTRESPQWN